MAGLWGHMGPLRDFQGCPGIPRNPQLPFKWGGPTALFARPSPKRRLGLGLANQGGGLLFKWRAARPPIGDPFGEEGARIVILKHPKANFRGRLTIYDLEHL